ncbi:MAG: hypothetical protein AVDCRST_MAG05-3353 [uncultured Rubrobacteraceae bacterium]|uniref:Uncharacterized protein n=1 Tax=uncultured Rubrobacteraceae bacterium TaxID=349277 RepID=A0A6J4T957_9ACTN|nr:MAG: hypothetical protein AVDCRST_MAG05-3353 [uncultured Rubrobacteraceae bacterium]
MASGDARAAHAPHAAGYAAEAVVFAAGLDEHAVAGGATCSTGFFRSAFVPWRIPTGEGCHAGPRMVRWRRRNVAVARLGCGAIQSRAGSAAWGGLTRRRKTNGKHTQRELQLHAAGRVSAPGWVSGQDPDDHRGGRRDGRGGGHRQDAPGQDHPRHHRKRPRFRARPAGGRVRRGAAGGPGRQRLRQDLPDAHRGQDRGPLEAPDPDARRPLDGLHARRRPRLPRHPRRPRARLQPDHQAQHRGRGLRRDRGARPRGHRTKGCDARHGGQGGALQAVRER